jgi:hypothetical protein
VGATSCAVSSPLCVPADPACGCEVAEHDGHVYLFCPLTSSFSPSLCAQTGMHLVTLDTQGESDWVGAETEARLGKAAYLGYHQDPSGSEPGGGWGWTYPSSGGFTNWNFGEPSNGLFGTGNEDCAAINWSGLGWDDSEWNDVECDSDLGFICEGE